MVSPLQHPEKTPEIVSLEAPLASGESNSSGGVDRLGALASSLCAVHCALAALLPASLGALGLGFLLGHEAEWLFTIVAVAFATGACVLGWRQHRSRLVAALLVVGILGLLASRFIEMGAGHAEHHGPSHHEAGEAHSHEQAAPHGHHEESSFAHGAGTAVGVLAGLLLFSGHILNLRASRARRHECTA